MKNIVDILLWVVGIAAFGVAIWQFILFVQAEGANPNTNLWISIGTAVVGCVCILGYFLRHVNKEEEIHITQ